MMFFGSLSYCIIQVHLRSQTDFNPEHHSFINIRKLSLVQQKKPNHHITTNIFLIFFLGWGIICCLKLNCVYDLIRIFLFIYFLDEHCLNRLFTLISVFCIYSVVNKGEQNFSQCWMCFFHTGEFVWRLAACESIHVALLIGPCCLAGASIKDNNVKFRFWTLPWIWKPISEEFKSKHKTCWNVHVLTSLMFIYLGTKKCS